MIGLKTYHNIYIVDKSSNDIFVFRHPAGFSNLTYNKYGCILRNGDILYNINSALYVAKILFPKGLIKEVKGGKAKIARSGDIIKNLSGLIPGSRYLFVATKSPIGVLQNMIVPEGYEQSHHVYKILGEAVSETEFLVY